MIPYDDFDVNAVGTMNMLVAARDFCRETPFCFTSTNKVYGDRPNFLSRELEKRYDYANGLDGIYEYLSIDESLRSLLALRKRRLTCCARNSGATFRRLIGIFRCGCLTGPHHAAVELHGYLAYIVLVCRHWKALYYLRL